MGPADLPLFAQEQNSQPGFTFQPFRTEVPISWLCGSDLLTGEAIWVPAQLALLYYKCRASEIVMGYPTGGGLGFGTSRRRAILHGLYEYVERDAINVRWHRRMPPPRVEFDLPNLLARVWSRQRWRIVTPSIERIDVQLATVDLPVPVLTVTARDSSRRERVFLGAGGAGSSRQRDLAQVLFELGQTQAVLISYRPKSPKVIRVNTVTSEMTDFLDGTVYFGF